MSDEDSKELNPRKRGLGRGLSALFDDEETGAGLEEAGPGVKRAILSVGQLEPSSYQPRKIFDDSSIVELAESIRQHGVLQPILVRPKSGFDGMYEIVAGERRWRAAQKAQLHEVPVVIRDLSDRQTLEIALIENLQREDLGAMDEARALAQLIEEFGHTQEKTAEMVGKSRSYVANMVRLLRLPRPVTDLINDGKLSAGHARVLVTAKDPEGLAQEILEKDLSVRQAEALAGTVRDGADRKNAKGQGPKKQKDADTRALEEEIGNALGMKVSIDLKTPRSGSLKIDFSTLEQLDEVLHRLSHFPGARVTG